MIVAPTELFSKLFSVFYSAEELEEAFIFSSVKKVRIEIENVFMLKSFHAVFTSSFAP